MRFIEKYSKINVEEKVIRSLNLSSKKISFLVIMGLVLSVPYGLKAGAIGIDNLRTYISESKAQAEAEAGKQKEIEIQGIINSGEEKYRPYIESDTERYLDFVKEFKLGNLVSKVYLNKKDNDVVCHFTDSVLNADFIIAYNPEKEITNISFDFIEDSKLNYKLYDYSNGVLLTLVETPNGYEKNIEIMDLSSYKPEISFDEVNIDYSNIPTTLNSNLISADDYLETVYEEGNKKYLPLLKEGRDSFNVISQAKVLDKRNNLDIKTQVFRE